MVVGPLLSLATTVSALVLRGRTSGAVAATDNPKIVAPFNADHAISFVDYDLPAVAEILRGGDVILFGLKTGDAVIENFDRLIEQAYSTGGPEGSFRSVTDESLRLTKEEAAELAADLDELLQRWGARTRGRDDQRRTYQLFMALQPHPDVVAEGRDEPDPPPL